MCLLDTDILGEVLRPRPDLKVVRHLLTLDPALRFGSEITRYELLYGAMRGVDGGALRERIAERLVPLVQWLPVDADVALAAADLLALQRREGRAADRAEAMLAATTHVRDLTMVTRNARHFDHVPGLQIENWFDPA